MSNEPPIIDASRDTDSRGRIERWPKKRARQIAALEHIVSRFEFEREYSEAEVNTLISSIIAIDDYALFRRELIVHGFLERTPSGAQYWRSRTGVLDQPFY